MTEGSRQVFSALELGPGCLVLGINGAVRLTCRLANDGQRTSTGGRSTRRVKMARHTLDSFGVTGFSCDTPNWMSKLRSYSGEEVPM